MKCLRLAPELACVQLQSLVSSSHHAKEKLRLSSLLLAGANALLVILPRDAFIGLAVIGADAGACTYELRNETVVYRVLWDPLRKSNDRLAKTGGALFKVVRLAVGRILMEDRGFTIGRVCPEPFFPA